MTGGKERRDKEKRNYYRGMEEDRTIMCQV